MLISFIIPIFNREKVIRRCISSIYKSFENNINSFEIIIIDDGSTDKSVKIVKDYILDKKIRCKIILNKINKGSNISRNNGLINSDGEWCVLLDSDDELFINSTKLINYFNAYNNNYFLSFRCVNKNYDLVGHKQENIQEFNYEKYENNNEKMFEKLDCINIKKLNSNEIKIFDENIYLGCDFLSWSRFLKKNRKNIIINEIGRIYYEGASNQITKKSKKIK